MTSNPETFIVYRSRRFYLFMSIWFTLSGFVTGAFAFYYGTANLGDTRQMLILVLWLLTTLLFYKMAFSKRPMLIADQNGLRGNVTDLEPIQWWQIQELLLLQTAGQDFMAIVTRDGEDLLNAQQGLPRSLIKYPLIPADTFSVLVKDNIDRPAPYFIPLSVLPISPEQLIEKLSPFTQTNCRYI
jgi:hypothetical protein